MVQVLEKSRLSIKLDFGRHHTARDAEPIRKHIMSFKPHLFVLEHAGCIEARRKEQMEGFNRWLPIARRSPDGRREFFAEYAKTTLAENNAMAQMNLAFSIAKFDAILSGYRLSVYIPKGFSSEELGRMQDAAGKYQADRVPMHSALLKGLVSQALDIAERSERDFISGNIAPANERFAEGFELMLEEIPGMFGRLPGLREIRALARYGTAHAPLAHMLSGRGFRLECPPSLAMENIRVRAALRLHLEKEMRLTAEERFELLFDRLCGPMFMQNEDGEESMREEMAAFRSLGAEGFASILRSAAAEARGDIQRFMSSLNLMVGRAAGK